MGRNGAVVRSLMMITKISISMLVPIFLCLFFGIKLNEWLDTKLFVPVFLFLGMGAAIRNVYHITKSFYAKDKKLITTKIYEKFDKIMHEKETRAIQQEKNRQREFKFKFKWPFKKKK